MGYHWNFAFLLHYQSLIWLGLTYTIGFTIGTTLCALTLGGMIALIRLSNLGFIGTAISGFMEIFRCTPVLVQLIWCYYALPIVSGITMSASVAAFVTLTLYGASFFSEIIRGGIISIEAGQWDAGRALGMRRYWLMKRIILPQAMRRMVPPLVNQTVLQLKNTSLLSVLAVPDLLYQGQLITSASYRPLETYTMVAIVYFALLFPLTRIAKRLEARKDR